MGTRVLLATPLRADLGISGVDNGLPVVDSRHEDAVESTVAKLASLDGQLIVTCATQDLAEIRRLITFAEIRHPHIRVALEPIDGTPLAVGVISSLVDEIGNQQDASGTHLARQFSALDHLRQRVWSAAWLPSVSKLRSPAPSVLQHARSILPGSGFLAIHGGRGRVINASRRPLTGIEPLPDHVLLHSPPEAPDWVLPAVTTAVSPSSTSEVRAVREPVDTFGRTDVVEFVAIPADFHEASLPVAAAVATCAACGVQHARSACPFCKMAAASADLQGAVNP